MITRQSILQEIFEEFQQMTQWVTASPQMYSEHYNRAAGLVECIEVYDCGSIGGFDKLSPVKHETGLRLYDRFLALLRRNNTKIKSICGFTVPKMTKYWSTINSLRDKTLQ